MRFFHNNRGSAIVPALVGILALSVIGFSIMQYSYYDTAKVIREEREKQAYYMARSGLRIMENYILAHVNDPVKVAILDQSLGISNPPEGYFDDPGHTQWSDESDWSELVYFNEVTDLSGTKNHLGFQVKVKKICYPDREDEYIIYSKGLAGPTKQSLYDKSSSVVVVVELDTEGNSIVVPGSGNPGSDNPGSGNPGSQGPGGGSSDEGGPGGGQNPGDNQGPGDGTGGSENPGSGNPGSGNPGSGNPGNGDNAGGGNNPGSGNGNDDGSDSGNNGNDHGNPGGSNPGGNNGDSGNPGGGNPGSGNPGDGGSGGPGDNGDDNHGGNNPGDNNGGGNNPGNNGGSDGGSGSDNDGTDNPGNGHGNDGSDGGNGSGKDNNNGGSNNNGGNNNPGGSGGNNGGDPTKPGDPSGKNGDSPDKTHGPAKPRNYGPRAAIVYSGKAHEEMPDLFYKGLLEPSLPTSFFGSEENDEAGSIGNSGSKIKFGSWYEGDGQTYEDIDEQLFNDIEFEGQIKFNEELDLENFEDLNIIEPIESQKK